MISISSFFFFFIFIIYLDIFITYLIYILDSSIINVKFLIFLIYKYQELILFFYHLTIFRKFGLFHGRLRKSIAKWKSNFIPIIRSTLMYINSLLSLESRDRWWLINREKKHQWKRYFSFILSSFILNKQQIIEKKKEERYKFEYNTRVNY